jgi:hypothetical protein
MISSPRDRQSARVDAGDHAREKMLRRFAPVVLGIKIFWT